MARRQWCSMTAAGAGSLVLSPGLLLQPGRATAAADPPRSHQAAGSASQAPRVAAPTAIELLYDGYLITGFGSTRIAKATMQFTPRDSRYQMQLRVDSMLADLSYRSEGQITAAGLQPESYVEHRKVAFRSAREKSVQYVRTTDASAINQYNGKTLTVPPGTQDRLSLLIQFSLMAQANPGLLTPGHETEIPFARVRSVSASRWSAGPVQSERADGADSADQDEPAARSATGPVLVAQRVARVATKKESVDVSFWLAADASRLPLILQFSENGRRLRFVARRA